MVQWLAELTLTLAGFPVLQGAVAALSTFILEDPTTVGCGLLVADGKLAFSTALIGVSVGIALGDLGLFGLGRLIGPATLSRGWLSDARVAQARSLYDRNLVTAVVLSRFMPGMRLPTYLGAGLFGASFVRFALAVVAASLVWTFLLLSATLKFGEAVLPRLGDLKWPVLFVLLVGFVLARRLVARNREKDDTPAGESPVSSFELWPAPLFYLPVGLYYLWLAVRYRGLTLPTAANPSVYSGGMIGESKSQILDLVPEPFRSMVCRYVRIERVAVSPEQQATEAERTLRRAGLDYPCVAKPDVGQRGTGVRLIRSKADLVRYLDAFPLGRGLLVQEYAEGPFEAGILYYRVPGATFGEIFSVTIKDFPQVEGDGRRSLKELILADPRARFFTQVYFERFRGQLDRVLGEGELLPLVFAGNHCQGAVFRRGDFLITAALRQKLDILFSAMPDFYFGRLDVRCRDLEELAAGRGFKVLEINGAGSEATHIWDPDTRLADAYRTLFKQYDILFRIGSINRARGVVCTAPVKFLRDCWTYYRLSRAYPDSVAL
ncbi:MAG: VTT domain-containing protein [Acidobacteriota bacterium]